MSVGTLNTVKTWVTCEEPQVKASLLGVSSSRNLLLGLLVQLLVLLPLLLQPLLLQHLLVHLVHLLARLLQTLLLHLRRKNRIGKVEKNGRTRKRTCVKDFGLPFFFVTGRESSLWNKTVETEENLFWGSRIFSYCLTKILIGRKTIKEITLTRPPPEGWCCHGQMLCWQGDAPQDGLEK